MVLHTPHHAFQVAEALEAFTDGALVFDDTGILAVGLYSQLSPQFPNATRLEYKNAFILPGFIDCHVHFPQVSVIGAMGLQLLEWLETRTLPFEESLEDATLARELAKDFLRLLAQNGTTTALVFGAHFEAAMHAFFDEAHQSGLRISSGMVLSDRELRPKLHQEPQAALTAGQRLLECWHGIGRLRYAVMPRFALSCSDDMLAVCQTLLEMKKGVLFHTHINENPSEIDVVKKLAGATDYLEAYERHNLVRRQSIFAHSVHPSISELRRMAKAGSSVAHCASSNAFIGSGLFPLKTHLEHNVRVALGSDVGGGTGFSILKEGLEAYQMQMLRQEMRLTPTQLLYLATQAGADALELGDVVGSFATGKQADFVVLKALQGSTLEATLARSPSTEASLAALFTLAREETVLETWVGGERVYQR